MSEPLVIELLKEMRAEAELAFGLVSTRESERIQEDPFLSRGLALSLMVIGEAAARMPEPFRLSHPDIAWNQARALRNRIAHGYRTVIPALLIDTARTELPELIRQIDALLKDLEP